jgi:hypothetical protein
MARLVLPSDLRLTDRVDDLHATAGRHRRVPRRQLGLRFADDRCRAGRCLLC